MTPEDSAKNKELLERYRRASDAKPAVPSEAVRGAILAEGRRVAAQRARSVSEQPIDVYRHAANDSRWKITAFGTAGAALLAALLFAPRLWENAKAPVQTRISRAAPPPAPTFQPPSSDNLHSPASAAQSMPTADSLKTLHQDRQEALAKLAPGAKSLAEKKQAESPAEVVPATAPSAAGAAATAATGYAQSEVGANRVRSYRATAAAEPSKLLAAAALGDTAKIRTLMDQGVVLDERDEQGRTPLMLAVIDARPDVVRLLLERGADPNAADNSGRTPLKMARQANLREIATLLEHSGGRQDADK